MNYPGRYPAFSPFGFQPCSRRGVLPTVSPCYTGPRSHILCMHYFRTGVPIYTLFNATVPSVDILGRVWVLGVLLAVATTYWCNTIMDLTMHVGVYVTMSVLWDPPRLQSIYLHPKMTNHAKPANCLYNVYLGMVSRSIMRGARARSASVGNTGGIAPRISYTRRTKIRVTAPEFVRRMTRNITVATAACEA